MLVQYNGAMFIVRPFPVRLENPHVIEKHQVWIGTLKSGPDATTLNSNYETRYRMTPRLQ